MEDIRKKRIGLTRRQSFKQFTIDLDDDVIKKREVIAKVQSIIQNQQRSNEESDDDVIKPVTWSPSTEKVRSKHRELPKNTFVQFVIDLTENDFLLQVILLLPLMLMTLYILLVEGGPLIVTPDPLDMGSR